MTWESVRQKDRHLDTSKSPQHKLHWAIVPLRRISGELCAGWLRLGHTAKDGPSHCLAAVPLLGERTWLQGCSWFEMVSGLTPGEHQPGRIGSLNLSCQTFASSRALWPRREVTSEGLLSWLWAAQWISSKLQGVITSHQVCLTTPPTLSMEAPRPVSHRQLSVLKAESLSGSWATCHWHGNNKEQTPQCRDTCGIHAFVGLLLLHRYVHSTTVTYYDDFTVGGISPPFRLSTLSVKEGTIGRRLKSHLFKTIFCAPEAPGTRIKPHSIGFLAAFWWREGFSSLPSYYLHTVRDYTEARTGIHCLPICFFYLKTPPSFSIIFSISSLTWRKTWLQKGQCSLDFSSSCTANPHPSPHPAYCFRTQEGCAPSSLLPLTSSPCLLWSSPPFPTYNSISPHHNLSISQDRPPGLRGLEMETGFVCQLTALLLCFLAFWPLLYWMVPAFVDDPTNVFLNKVFGKAALLRWCGHDHKTRQKWEKQAPINNQ